MKTIESLRLEIQQIEEQLEEQWVDLKAETQEVLDDLNPLKKMKRAFSSALESGTIKEGIMDTLLSFSTGFLSKKAVFGNTKNPIKKLLGIGLQFLVSELVYKNSGTIKTVLRGLFSKDKNESKGDVDEEIKTPTP